ncbi:MAG: GNAT family N-acetyltransferase [Eubacterium sp.]|nr:GNAT family N-acetyltransferase [Eubacterium sp.]
MEIRKMTQNDITSVIPLYINYYNNQEGSCWNEGTATKRIRQVMSIDDSYALILINKEEVIGFVMGYFKQYDDIVGYTLDEIVIAYEHQNKGFGSMLLHELEERVKELGASCVELQAVSDKMHERYYGKAGYHDANNFVMKVKWFD